MSANFMPKIEVKRSWNSEDMKKFLDKDISIGDDYSTYDDHIFRMLDFVDKHEPTTENLYLVTLDIHNHTSSGMPEIKYLMERLEVNVVHREFVIEPFNPFSLLTDADTAKNE